LTLIATLKERARALKAEVLALFLAARHPRTPWYAKLFLAAIVAYALSPIDLIPDFIPVLGLVDDIILVPLGIALAMKMIPADVMEECRARASQRRPDIARAGRVGAVIIVLLWIAVIVLAAIWARDSFAHQDERGKIVDQFSAQLPGPPGWPQVPHAPAAAGSASAVEPAVAKTDSFFSRSVERQPGHAGTVPERTSDSNSRPQLRHPYSNIGMERIVHPLRVFAKPEDTIAAVRNVTTPKGGAL
jgi:uncharacterized membrane protein YkvA (DUF1232 family)